MELGYFFCGDILGFSKIVENLSQDELDKKIEQWVSIVQAAAIKGFRLPIDHTLRNNKDGLADG